MKFFMDGKIRYSEVDSNGILTIDGLVNYLQDSCMLHSEVAGRGYRELTESRVAWFLSSWQIQILRMPRVYEDITVMTNPYDFKGFFGYRNFTIENPQKERLIQANSIWVYLNIDSQKPQRIPESELAGYGPVEPKLEMDYAPRKMDLNGDFEVLPPVPVRPEQIDTNHHVNNCQYIKTALELAELTELPKEIRVEFCKQAHLGDVFYPRIARTEKEITVDLQDEQGNTYSPVKFIL